MKTLHDRLTSLFGTDLRLGVPLAPFTWMRVGGPAEFFVEVDRVDRLIAAHDVCRRLSAPFVLLGGGSNVVIDDAGLAGLVVVNRLGHLEWEDSKRQVTVGGGFELDRLIGLVAARGWADLSFAAGIPGTVGGALAGGAGAYGRLLAEAVCAARVLRHDGSLERVPVEALGVRYRDSDVLQRGDILLEATFGGFAQADPTVLRERIDAIKAERAGKHPPRDLPCAGSFFKNLPPPEPGACRIAAGLLLDRCGAKQLVRGGAAVFERHANIIVNTGSATAADIMALAGQMADLVHRRHGIRLEPEVRYLCNRPG